MTEKEGGKGRDRNFLKRKKVDAQKEPNPQKPLIPEIADTCGGEKKGKGSE